MSAAAASDHTASGGLPGVSGSYHGRPTRRLETPHCWVEFLAAGGPRIVGFGLAGEPSILAQTPDVSWDAGYGTFELLGGHRLWFAPETSKCSVPDSAGLVLSEVAGAAGPAARLAGAVQASSGLRKTVEVRLDPDTASVLVRHVITNEGDEAVELSPWPITQLRPGGVATVELPGVAAEHSLNPTQLIALWPYASWDDERLAIGAAALTVAARPGKPFKIGCLSHLGAASYLLDGVRFTKSWDPAIALPHADMGCNTEIYADQNAIEIESLGPLVRLEPGQSTTHDETWELRRVG